MRPMRPRCPRRRHRLQGVLAVSLSLLVVGCAGGPPPVTYPGAGWSQTGTASWYGPGFHGKATASGERYDMEALTAAHRRLAFGTRVRVENLDNGRVIDVRINDRGPFVGGRIIDLSRAAARALGMLGPGTAPVRLLVLDPSPLLECSVVQVGAFAEADNARALAERLEFEGHAVDVEKGDDGLTRVLLGPYSDLSEAERVRRRRRGILKACA